MSKLPGSPAYGLAAADPPHDSGPWPAFWLLAALGTFLAYLDVTIVNVAFPDIAGDFDESGLGALSWVVNGYALAFAALFASQLCAVLFLTSVWGYSTLEAGMAAIPGALASAAAARSAAAGRAAAGRGRSARQAPRCSPPRSRG